MKHKHTAFVALSFCFFISLSCSLTAQEYNEYNISKYYTPDIVRNQLDLDLRLNMNTNQRTYSFKNGLENYQNQDKKENRFFGYFSIGFNRDINTRKFISSLDIRLNAIENYNSTKEKDENLRNDTHYNNEEKLFKSDNNIDANWNNKHYVSSSLSLSYGLVGRFNYKVDSKKSTDNLLQQTTDSKQTHSYFSASPQIGIGFGRIEQVKDARQAVYILNALSKKNILKRTLSENELFDFAQKISTIKNKRFLDSRRHLIEEITTVDSFFDENDLLADNDAAYFTTLYDMWQYGALFERKSGYEFSLLYLPGYSIQQNNEISTPANDLNGIDAYKDLNNNVQLNFSYEKPVKLNWQHSANIYLRTSFQKSIHDSNGEQSENHFRNLHAYASYSLSYFPNTRTHLQATIFAHESLHGNKDDELKDYSNDLNSGLRLNAYYYISPQVRISGNYNLNMNKWKSTFSDGDILMNNFEIQFRYSFF